MTKRVQPNGAKIELIVNVFEVVSEQERKYTGDQIKAFEILQRKAEQGYKEVDSFIKTRVIDSTPINIVILIGKTGIIDSYIKHQMKEAISFYTFHFIRISLGSPSEIITAMQEHEKTADILILSRGGGDNLEIFENPAIAEVSLSLRCIFLTAIGNKENIPLLQKVADKAFITPTASGQYLNDIYNETHEQLQNSKAKLTDDISRQFKANYDKQIQTLNEKLKATEELNERAKNDISSNYQKEIELQKKEIDNLNSQYANQIEQIAKLNEERASLAKTQIEQMKMELAKSSSAINWAFVIAAVILGVLIGRSCN